VGDPYGRVGLVDVLAAGAARPVGVDPQVVFVDLDVGLIGQKRGDDHLREGRVPPVSGVERREAYESVDAPLGLEDPVGVLAGDCERRGLEPGLLPGARLDEVGFQAALLCPAEIHPKQDLGPVLRVGAAGAGVDRDDGVAGVVLAGEEGVLA
jgi:hypothetical protein